MENTDKSIIGTLGRLSDQLAGCKIKAAKASLLAEDLYEYFDTPAEDEGDLSFDKKTCIIHYFIENGLRAGMLLDYLYETDRKIKAISAEVGRLHSALREAAKQIPA